MKKLKKILSLLLVAAMVFSFAATALAVDNDYDDYDYNTAAPERSEAVQALTNLGILDGTGNSMLTPDGVFTRAQAAKILTYMLLGADNADVLKVSASDIQFTDVSADAWYAPFVQYCADQGLVNGYDAYTFGPNDVLTIDQWLKLLVAAISDNRDGLIGSNWAENAYALALKYDIITADEYAACADLTREDAILLAWRALRSEVWSGDCIAEDTHNVEDGHTYERDIYGGYVAKDVVLDDKDNTVIATQPIEADKTYSNQEVAFTDKDGKVLDEYAGYTFYVDGVVVGPKAAQAATGLSTEVLVYTDEAYDDYAAVVVIDEHNDVVTSADDVKKYGDVDPYDVVTYTIGYYYVVRGWDKQPTMENLEVVPATIAYCNSTNHTDNLVKLDGETYEFAWCADHNSGVHCCAQDFTAENTYEVYFDDYGNIVYEDDYYEPVKADLIFATQAQRNVKVETNDDGIITKTTTYWVEYVDLDDGSYNRVQLDAFDDAVVKTYGLYGDDAVVTSKDKNVSKFYGITAYMYLLTYEDGTVGLFYGPMTQGNDITVKKVDKKPYACFEDEATAKADDPDDWDCVADNAPLTEIVYTPYFQTVDGGYNVYTDIDEYRAYRSYEAVDGINTYVCWFYDEYGRVEEMYCITPYAATETTQYGAFEGTTWHDDTNTLYYKFKWADGTESEVPSKNVAFSAPEGTICEVTFVDGVVTNIEKATDVKGLTVVTGTAYCDEITAEGWWINLDDSTRPNCYRVAPGVTAEINFTSWDAFGKETAGDTVNLYVLNNQVVYIEKVPAPMP